VGSDAELRAAVSASAQRWRAFQVLAISREVSGTSTRPPFPARSIAKPQQQPDGLEDLEELGDDAIIAQQTAAHAPQPRANVSEESRSVVITDHPQRRDTEPPRASRQSPPRSSGEATLVIRDRRALDELRSQIERGRIKPPSRRRPLYLWGALGLAAFVLGGIVAFLATDSRDTSAAASPVRVEAQIALPRAAAPSPPVSKPEPATPSVRLDDLPVEPPRKH
jgi:hypothetical protein